jgi:predicted metal-dependent enzyme (double-stranded beta helix superfamily)
MTRPTTVRDCALRLIELLDKVGDDVLAKEKELAEAVGNVLALPDLEIVNANPSPTAIEPGQASVGWLYQDGDVRIVRGKVPVGMAQQPHNHGSWNLFGVYRGAVKYRSYRRLDDRSVPYFADLEVVEDRIMTDGDVTVLPGPPHDIHAVTGLAPMTTTVLVARGSFDAVREHYIPEDRCYTHEAGDTRGRA